MRRCGDWGFRADLATRKLAGNGLRVLEADFWTGIASDCPVIRELRDSLPTSPVCRMRSQITYSEIIPIVPSHVSTN